MRPVESKVSDINMDLSVCLSISYYYLPSLWFFRYNLRSRFIEISTYIFLANQISQSQRKTRHTVSLKCKNEHSYISTSNPHVNKIECDLFPIVEKVQYSSLLQLFINKKVTHSDYIWIFFLSFSLLTSRWKTVVFLNGNRQFYAVPLHKFHLQGRHNLCSVLLWNPV